ncbi:Hint domain-containing protein [Pseudooceanicola algae]|uniref:Hedgehog/Intein (Hint) domain-containing protein n=1 Tax=Pseudooceanicola algae TaxID=1537215 RepID=A0A418SG10_9RHOB|nr:Hint domain-containing protein [Pseudooceanicola algae]QPM91585.1 hypothetical protein PSAL_028400 [Pseudooceanicola algae]
MTESPEPISGLGPGTMVLTLEGDMPIEWLAPGDKVMTRDHGAMPVLHICRLRKLPEGGALPAPMRFQPGELGPQGELQGKLRVAPGHRGLIRHGAIRQNFGCEEALVRFCDISRRNRARKDPTMGGLTYHLIIMEHHEVINAGSLWIETTGPDMAARLDLPDAVRRATRLLDPETPEPRRCLTRQEARLIRDTCPQETSLLDLLSA